MANEAGGLVDGQQLGVFVKNLEEFVRHKF